MNIRQKIGIGAIFIVGASALWYVSTLPDTASSIEQPATDTGTAYSDTNQSETVQNTSTAPQGELKIETTKPGTGDRAVKVGDTVSVHYTGTFDDGKIFDSSRDRGQPFPFTVGQGQVIEGWDKGLIGMKVGEKRKLTIPPSMGYGAAGYPGAIPPNATLHFDIELMAIK